MESGVVRDGERPTSSVFFLGTATTSASIRVRADFARSRSAYAFTLQKNGRYCKTHTCANRALHIHEMRSARPTSASFARSSAGPRPGHGAWDEVPRRPVIEPVIATAIGIVIGIVMVILIVIVIVIVIRPVARKRKARIETPRRRRVGCCRNSKPAKKVSKCCASAIGHGHKEEEQEKSPGHVQRGARGVDGRE